MSSEFSSAESKSQTRSGGPRTASGKAKSSQNSSKHKIFVQHVLPEEEKDATILFEGVCQEFHLDGPMELRIGRDLVQNEFESQRIEKFAAQQSLKAQKLADLSVEQFHSHSTPLFRLPIPKEKESEAAYCTRLRPKFCAMFLESFKKHIEAFGPQPKEDLESLRLIYGNEITGLGEAIVAHYNMFVSSERARSGEKKTPGRKDRVDQTLLFEAIEREIEAQKNQAMLDDMQAAVINLPDEVVFPTDEVSDRIERYRAANTRKRTRLIEALQTIRDLKHDV